MSEASSGDEVEFRGGPRAGAPLPPGPLLGFVVAVAAVAFIALLTYRSLQTRSLAANRVTHTLQVMDQLEAILSLAKDAETGQRGYLLTGEESYLEPFSNAKTELPEELRKAYDLVENDPVQLQRLKNLEQAVKDKLLELDQTIALRRKGEGGAALVIVRSDRGKALMDRIRQSATTMGATKVGTRVNLEVDVVAKYVERLLAARDRESA